MQDPHKKIPPGEAGFLMLIFYGYLFFNKSNPALPVK
jgi:hypothetical protein